MEFEYQITADDYALGCKLYFGADDPRKRRQIALSWVVFGAAAWVFVINNPDATRWLTLVAAAVGTVGVCFGMCNVVYTTKPWQRRYYGEVYRRTDFARRVYRAHVDEQGLTVADDAYMASIKWCGARIRREHPEMFVIGNDSAIFMINKRHLTATQQQELRALAGIPHS